MSMSCRRFLRRQEFRSVWVFLTYDSPDLLSSVRRSGETGCSFTGVRRSGALGFSCGRFFLLISSLLSKDLARAAAVSQESADQEPWNFPVDDSFSSSPLSC